MDALIVVLAVGLSAVFLAKRFISALSAPAGGGCGCGCSGCGANAGCAGDGGIAPEKPGRIAPH